MVDSIQALVALPQLADYISQGWDIRYLWNRADLLVLVVDRTGYLGLS